MKAPRGDAVDVEIRELIFSPDPGNPSNFCSQERILATPALGGKGMRVNSSPSKLTDEGSYLAMQSDCNLVLYDHDGTWRMASGTQRKLSADEFCYSELQDDGNFVVYIETSSGKKPLWSALVPVDSVRRGTRLTVGNALYHGDTLNSPNGRFEAGLEFTREGLRIVDAASPGRPSTRILYGGPDGVELVMRDNCTFELRNDKGVVVLAGGAAQPTPATCHLQVSDGGMLEIVQNVQIPASTSGGETEISSVVWVQSPLSQPGELVSCPGKFPSGNRFDLQNPDDRRPALCPGACGRQCTMKTTKIDTTTGRISTNGSCVDKGTEIWRIRHIKSGKLVDLSCMYSLTECGSHKACRDHDACYSDCSLRYYRDSDEVFGGPLGVCKRVECDTEVAAQYPPAAWFNWIHGDGPQPDTLSFSMLVSAQESAAGPNPPDEDRTRVSGRTISPNSNRTFCYQLTRESCTSKSECKWIDTNADSPTLNSGCFPGS